MTSRLPSSPPARDGRAWLGAAWAWLFLCVMMAQPLPNNGGVRRYELLPHLPFAVLDALDPPMEPQGPPRGLAYLGERLGLWGTAAFVMAAAWGAGLCLLAPLRGLALTRAERGYFATLLGLGVVALGVLGCGLLGRLSPPVFWGWHALLLIAGAVIEWRSSNRSRDAESLAVSESTVTPTAAPSFWASAWWWLAVSPFLIGMLFGSVSPSTDFDVNEYHLGGPKEWWLAGHIHFLSHNIYTSFPFLTEMLLLDGMVVCGDWSRGALAGQAVLMGFAPVTAWGIWVVGRRWFSPTAGAIGALVFLSTPWVFRMSIIAYAEGGLTAYVFGTTAAGLFALHQMREIRVSPTTDNSALRRALQPRAAAAYIALAGLCAGGAMASKYTGLVMAVGPWLGMLSGVALLRAKATLRALGDTVTRPWGWRVALSGYVVAIYVAATLVLVGPWLLKNAIETRNPVYPLGYSLFDGRDLDDELAAKWKRGHARPSAGSVVGEIQDLGVKAFDVAAVNDWQTPLVGALAPLALLWPGDRRRIAVLMGVTVWLFLAWWIFTHHLDRFWLPLLPTAATLAGIGAACVLQSSARGVLIAAVAAGWLFNLGFCSTGLVGYNAGLTKLEAATDFAARITGPEVAWLNEAVANGAIPADARVLCVGEAELFAARFDYRYNTVFDRSLLEEWLAAPEAEDAALWPLRPIADIRAKLAAEGITHLYVNWGEILRYRQTYGYSDFVRPSKFAELRQAGVLAAPLRLPAEMGLRPVESLSPGERAEVERWAPELLIDGPVPLFITGQIYPVVQ